MSGKIMHATQLAVVLTFLLTFALTQALDTHSRHVLQEAQPTAEDYERMKAEDRAAWAKTHQGGDKRKRALLADFGSAYGEVTETETPYSSPNKVQPDGNNCLISYSSSATEDCSSNLAYVVPACCSSSSENSYTKCQTWDNAQNIVCSNKATPYPACCTYRNQTVNACNLYTTDVVCPSSKPGVACCNASSCSLNYDGSGGTCRSGGNNKIGCCPA